MPKEQPSLGEHSLCAASSKNAKDKSNSTTLLAMCNTKEAAEASGRGSRCSSEKDSGFSDGSDCQQTDVEDQRSERSQSTGSERAKTSQPGQNQGSPGNPPLMPAGCELSPIYIINNMVLKQPDVIQERCPLPQRKESTETGLSGGTHVVLLQQPNLFLATLQLHKPSSRKSRATGKINGAYLPILNSYPRIAPHSSKKLPDKSSLKDESQNMKKRVCTEHKNEDTPVTVSQPEQHFYKQPKLAAMPCSSSASDSLSCCSLTAISSSQGSPSESSVYSTSSSFLSGRGFCRKSNASTRHRRFLNTVQVLRQSGLLDITLRTKELLRQSSTTERDIAQLRQHTELLCQAASKPSGSLNGITAWEHLHHCMAESGSYPNLKILQSLQMPCHPVSACQPDSISIGHYPPAAEHSEAHSAFPDPNQNCPVPQQGHSEQGEELQAGSKSSEKVTFTPPDSSTG